MFKKNSIYFKGNPSVNFFLIHGLTGSPGEFIPFVNKLTFYGNLHLISLPGHGKYPFNKKKDFSLSKILKNFKEFLKPYIHQKMIFVSHSLGGFLIDDEILKISKKDDKFFFISPFIHAKLKKELFGNSLRLLSKNKKLNLEKGNETDLKKYYENLISEIFSNKIIYKLQNNKEDKRIFKISGSDDPLLIDKENYINLPGGHNLHIDNPDTIISLIKNKL